MNPTPALLYLFRKISGLRTAGLIADRLARPPRIFAPLLTISLAISLSPLVVAAPVAATALQQAGFCAARLPFPAPPAAPKPAGDDKVDVSADAVEFTGQQQSRFSGNVIFVQGQRQLRADELVYDKTSGIATATGHVGLWDQGLHVSGTGARIDINNNRGTVDAAGFQAETQPGHGHAATIRVASRQPTELTGVDYTTCPDAGDVAPFWSLSADEMTLNHDTDVGIARNVRLKIRGTSVLRLPWLSFPLSDTRKSGFLFPSLANSTNGGLELKTPYYWNIAPDRDATLTPRYIEKRGLLLAGEFRLLRERGYSKLAVEYLPGDNAFGDNRNSVTFQHRETFSSRLRGTININRVSDDDYFTDLGNSLNSASVSHLDNQAQLVFRGRHWQGLARLQDYQTVDRTITAGSEPYKRLPQIFARTTLIEKNRQLNFSLEGEFVKFDRNSGITGNRMRIRPGISYPMRTVSSFVVPKLSFDYVSYDLNGVAPGAASSPDRALPVLSIDSGLFFERELNRSGTHFIQTLEPRLYYLYVPFESQADLPVFDTSRYTASLNRLFRDNRFSGADRLSDANQVSLSLTTRFLNTASGHETIRASIGQTWYFRDRRVSLPGEPVETDDTSDVIAEVVARLSAEWRLAADVQWNPHRTETEKSAMHIQYRPDRQRVMNLSYRLRKDSSDIEQTDMSARWPINRKWSAVGRWNYSLENQTSLETFAGLEYNDCCRAMRVVARRYLTDTAGNFNTGIFLQVELKGLGGFGTQTRSFLKKSIPGYENEF